MGMQGPLISRRWSLDTFFLHLTLIYLGGHVKTLPLSEKKMIKFFQTYITKQGCYHYYNMKIFVRSGP